MRNKMFKLIIAVFSAIIFTLNLKAECSDNELNDWAEKVKVEFKETKDSNSNQFAYILVTTPYNDKVTVKAKDTYSTDFYTVDYDEESKGNAIGSYIHSDKKTYIIKFYGNENSSCNGELLREIEFSVPSFNSYSASDICKQDKYKNEDICKMNTDTSNISTEDFKKELEKIDEDNKGIIYKIFKGIFNNWYYAVIPFILVAGFYLYKIYGFKKEQRKK